GKQEHDPLAPEPAWADEVDELPGLADDLAETTELEGVALADDEMMAEDGLVDALDERPTLHEEIEARLLALYGAVAAFTGCDGDPQPLADEVLTKLDAFIAGQQPSALSPQLSALSPQPSALSPQPSALSPQPSAFNPQPSALPVVYAWLFLHNLGRLSDATDFAQQSVSWMDEWLIGRVLTGLFQELGVDGDRAAQQSLLVKKLVTYQRWFETPAPDQAYRVLELIMGDPGVQRMIGVNRYQGVLWFNREQFEQLLAWMQFLAGVTIQAELADDHAAQLASAHATIATLRQAADQSEYQVAKLMRLAQV
ncbi:MAG: hypothetical protein H7Z42_10010, partial [Roseiflexaceae bacterium]|nr:hypothetical protein [Roseiflexaceae bacterium]